MSACAPESTRTHPVCGLRQGAQRAEKGKGEADFRSGRARRGPRPPRDNSTTRRARPTAAGMPLHITRPGTRAGLDGAAWGHAEEQWQWWRLREHAHHRGGAPVEEEAGLHKKTCRCRESLEAGKSSRRETKGPGQAPAPPAPCDAAQLTVSPLPELPTQYRVRSTCLRCAARCSCRRAHKQRSSRRAHRRCL